MTLWLVQASDYGDYFTAAVYDTEEQAIAERDRQAARDIRRSYQWDVEKIELNTPFEWRHE